MAQRKTSVNSSTIEINSTYNQQDPLLHVDNPALLDEQHFNEKVEYINRSIYSITVQI